MDPVYKQLDYLANQLTLLESQMNDQIDPRTFGQLEGAVTALGDKVGTLTKDVETLSKQVANLADIMSEAKGGWRAVAWIGGVAATIGGAMTWFLTHNITVGPK